MVRLTVLNDIHLKPAYETVVDDFTLPAETDAVVITGDLVDRDSNDSIAQGRQLLSRLEEATVPTVVVPGNHDPRDSAARYIGDFEFVQLAHDRQVTGADFPVKSVFGKLTVVGWGCTSSMLVVNCRTGKPLRLRSAINTGTSISMLSSKQSKICLLRLTNCLPGKPHPKR